MSDSDNSMDSSVEEKPEEQKPDTPINRKDLPRRLRVRYWHSWEELLLVELWRKHFDEITNLDKYLPIFRNISIGMRESGFHVTGQEIQRKIKALKIKYQNERRRLGESNDENAKSEWRLYPLIHYIMTTPSNKYDPFHEEKALKNILQRTQMDPLYHIIASGLPAVSTLEKIKAGEDVNIPPPIRFENCFPAENKTVAACIAHCYQNKDKRSYTPRTPRPSEIAATQARIIAADARAARMASLGITETHAQQNVSETSGYSNNLTPQIRNSVGPLKRLATADAIKQLKLENIKLVEDCLIAKKRLRIEEQQFKAYEKLIEQMQTQYENIFKNLITC